MARVYKKGREISEAKIATNSLSIVSGDFVSLSSGFVIKATTSGKIEGISKTENTFDSDNQTVAQEKVVYVFADEELRVEATADATITVADVGSYFNINADGTVDVATKSATWEYVNTSDAGAAVDTVIKMQLRLEDVLTSTLWIFSIVK